jgi:8-oxo-dGTP pyrophosphatase MutT (NUDIX family)
MPYWKWRYCFVKTGTPVKIDPMDWSTKLRAALSVGTEAIPALPPAVEGKLSSVLIPIGRHRDTGEEEILLTKRTMLVETHKGQISFPGGRHDPGDRDLMATALRESFEEIGTHERDVEVLGMLQPVLTQGHVWIYPFVGRMTFPYPFRINPGEVDRLLYLPLNTLLKEGLRSYSVPIENIVVKSPGIEVDGELVWGATARMLELLREHLLGLG